MRRIAPTVAPSVPTSTVSEALERAENTVYCSSILEEKTAGQPRTTYDLALPDAVAAHPFGTATGSDGLPTAPDLAPFLDWLYDDEQGYIEVVAGRTNPTDPTKIKLEMRTRRWCATRGAAVAYIEKLTPRYGNVYVGVRLYDERAHAQNTRSDPDTHEPYTRPSRVIFVDDAPAEPYLFYSLCVRTSEHSRHAYYKADAPTTETDARRAAKYLDGDPSGVDLTQLVRVPGTFNTKHNGRWPVEVEDIGPIYNLDELRAKFPPIAAERAARGVVTTLDWPEVEAHLSNMDALLGCARSQLIKPETQTGRILGGEMLPIGDGSRSMNGFTAIYGFYLRGFPDDELAAIGIYLYRKWGVERDKGTAWCKVDVARMIAKCHEKMPGVIQSPTRYKPTSTAQPIAEVKPISRARQDRPQRFTPSALYLEYQRRPELCDLKRKARAAALQVSTATLDRLEDALERDDLIAIETDPRRQGSRVILQGVINIAADEVLSGPAAAVADEAPNMRAESGQTAIEQPQCIGETLPPPNTPRPAAPPIVLDALVGDALDALTEAQVKTTFARVRKLVLAAADDQTVDLDQVKRLYARELKRRQWARQDAREERRARLMTRAALVKKSRAIATQAADLRRRNNPQAPIWTRRAGIYAAEEARRDALEAQRLAEQGYTLSEQRAMLDLIDQDNARKPAPRRTGRAARLAGGSVPPSPAAASIEPGRSPIADAAITRFKQARDLRQGASGYD